MLFDCGNMLRRTITFAVLKVILGIFDCITGHQNIPLDFSHNGSGSNGSAPRITLDDVHLAFIEVHCITVQQDDINLDARLLDLGDGGGKSATQ